MRWSTVLAVFVLSLAVLFAFACGQSAVPSPAPESVDGETLVNERCTTCHGLARVASAEKSLDEWRATVERMMGKGAILRVEETAILVEYLAATFE